MPWTLYLIYQEKKQLFIRATMETCGSVISLKWMNLLAKDITVKKQTK